MLDRDTIPAILRALETQLAELDRIGARLAAAHLDACILQLRRDLPRDDGIGRGAGALPLDREATRSLAKSFGPCVHGGSPSPKP